MLATVNVNTSLVLSAVNLKIVSSYGAVTTGGTFARRQDVFGSWRFSPSGTDSSFEIQGDSRQ